MSPPAIPSSPQTLEIRRFFKMLALTLRDLPAGHVDSSNRLFPYGLAALFLASVLLCLLVVFFAWRPSRGRPADSEATATAREHRASTMSPDTVSSLFPDRPIRPLPKRRLRERLSPDVAESIQYPPTPQTSTSLFYPPYSSRDEEYEAPLASRSGPEPARSHHVSRNGLGLDSDEDGARMRIANLAIKVSDSVLRSTLTSAKQDHAKQPSSQPPQSAASSADSYYDPFEITNNKKKRKIPTAGDATLNGNHGFHDSVHGPASPGTPMPSIEGHGELSPSVSSSYYGPGGLVSSNHNVSGPGRGRYGRVRNGRSPLRALSDSSNNWAGRNGKLRPSQWVSPSSENTGIISTAIANAEKVPPHPGQENLSLLQQQQSVIADPVTTQFTFTCDSQVPGSVAWPGTDRRHTVAASQVSGAARDPGRLSAPATYAASGPPNRQMADQAAQSATAKSVDPAQTAPAAPAQPKKTRKRLDKELAQAARDRRRDTHYANLRNPPDEKDVWICEFCEYEAIFGRPPVALIRKYEMKDRKARKEAAERHRLLEKAKMRSRKGKKNKTPAAPKANAPAQDRTTPQGEAAGPSAVPTEGEEYREEDYSPNLEWAGGLTAAALPPLVGPLPGGDETDGHRPLRPPTAGRANADSLLSRAEL